jgi:hypothetical protein
MVFALQDLIQEGMMPTFENLVAHAFELFPERFGLPGYPHYPDSLQVNRCWVRCRTDKRLIEGSASKGFKLTLRGLEVARKTARRLGMEEEELSKISRTKERRLGRVEIFVKHVEDSNAFRIYKEIGDLSRVSDYEFASMLRCPLDAPKRVLVENLEILISACQELKRQDLVFFLKRCREAFKNLLKEPGEGEFAGGMLKRRR